MRYLTVALLAAALACGGGGSPPGPGPSTQPPPSGPPPDPTYDLSRGVPRFVSQRHIAVSNFKQISRFRSSAGHSYTDAVESCRSMKHYFTPKVGISAAAMQIFAPVDGTVLAVDPEFSGFGLQLAIRPTAQPAFRLIIFHLTPGTTLRVGDQVTAGQLLGNHYGTNTDADIAVGVNSTEGYRLVSWFEVINDGVFDEFRAAGVGSRDDMIISRAARDADPLSCSDGTFTTLGTIPSWIPLR
jgi:hypothetical protein